MSCNISPHILTYLDIVDREDYPMCKEQKQLAALVRKAFEEEDITCDAEKLEKYLSYQKYFPFNLFEWEVFCFALHMCVFRADGLPRWPDLFIFVGRGAGKNGYLAFEDFCAISPCHGIKGYDIDICANAEDQAKRTFDDIYEVLESNRQKLKKHFYWNRERITCLKTNSTIRYRTNSPKSKDGLRSGKVDFDEVHEYEDYANITVYTTGLGKKPHPRRTYITTNGRVRGGVLDDYLAQAKDVLEGVTPDGGFLPFICRLDAEEEVDDETNWNKANPSLRYMPHLLEQMRKEYTDYKRGLGGNIDFLRKRMNLVKSDKEIAVADWDDLMAASEPLPDLTGWKCVAGIDYAMTTDFVAAGLLFRGEEKRYWLPHTWVCRSSPDLKRIKAPLDEWERQNLLTWVDDVEISPEYVTNWLTEHAERYHITQIAIDEFRYALLSGALKRIGYSVKDDRNLKLVRPSNIMRVFPVIKSMFINRGIAWGEPTMMRWYTNNTKAVPVNQRSGEPDVGNYKYGKIEGKSRKTDGFMALVAAMTIEDELDTSEVSDINGLPLLVY